jgi:hypothetical protein
MPKAQSPWDSPEARPKSGKFVKFQRVGDSAEGTVVSVSLRTFSPGEEDERTVPVIELAGGQSITCSARLLHELMFELQPQVGEHVSVTFVGTDEGNYGRKLFRVAVRRLDGREDALDSRDEVAAW